MEDAHFFSNAPVVSWMTWIQRKLFQTRDSMKLIPSELPTVLPTSPTGIPPRRMEAKRASEYSQWLKQHFTSPSTSYELILSPKQLADHLSNGDWIGVEVRDCDGALIGCIVCQYAGEILHTKSGLVTWLCVVPSWRKRGVANCLLRSIVLMSHPRTIFFWKNDGWLSSQLPPISNEARIVRTQYRSTVSSRVITPSPSLKPSQPIQPIPLTAETRNIFKTAWLQTNPLGLVLNDFNFQSKLIELYEATGPKGVKLWILLQPTFEIQKHSGERWCEVLAWVSIGQPCTDYEAAHYIEQLLNQLPYQQIDAPVSLPHLSYGWKSAGLTSWSVIGLDTGTSQSIPILPLCAA